MSSTAKITIALEKQYTLLGRTWDLGK